MKLNRFVLYRVLSNALIWIYVASVLLAIYFENPWLVLAAWVILIIPSILLYTIQCPQCQSHLMRRNAPGKLKGSWRMVFPLKCDVCNYQLGN